MVEKLIENAKPQMSEEDSALIRKAFAVAKDAHAGQYRESGEEYLIHPVALAYILADLQFDATTIAAALLHDVVEDTKYTLEDIEEAFGKEIASIVDGVTKIKQIKVSDQARGTSRKFQKNAVGHGQRYSCDFYQISRQAAQYAHDKIHARRKTKEKAQETLDVLCAFSTPFRDF